MSSTKWAGFVGGAAALALGSAGFSDDDVSNEELIAKVRSLETEVARLKGPGWLDEQRADEIRSLVHDVLADADTRSSLLQAGAGAGYDGGFYIGDADGANSVTVNGHMQNRFILNTRDELADETVWGFENTRTKLIFSGQVAGLVSYRIEGNFGRTGSFGLEDAWIRHSYDNGLSVKLGQFKLPLTRETLVYSGYQLAVERSDVDYLFTGGRSQGLMVEYEQDQWRLMGAFSDGAGNANTAYTAADTEYAFTGRFEFLASGNWEQFHDFTSASGDETGLLLGIAGHVENDEYGTSGGAADNEVLRTVFTLDAQAEFGGANAFGAFVYRNLDPETGADQDQYGIVLQGGVMINDDWEGFIRYEWADVDSASDDLSLLTLGVNRYFARHNVKWTTDVVIGIDAVPAEAAANTITGIRSDAADQDGQVAIRTQLQLLF